MPGGYVSLLQICWVNNSAKFSLPVLDPMLGVGRMKIRNECPGEDVRELPVGFLLFSLEWKQKYNSVPFSFLLPDYFLLTFVSFSLSLFKSRYFI